MTRVLIDALIIDQIIISDNKYYRLIIDHSLLPGGVTTYHPDEASVISIDNCKCIMCTYITYYYRWFACFHFMRTGLGFSYHTNHKYIVINIHAYVMSNNVRCYS